MWAAAAAAHKAWRSFSAMAPSDATVRRDPAIDLAPSRTARGTSRPDANRARNEGETQKRDRAPVSRRGEVPVDFQPLGRDQLASADSADSSTLFKRAETLLDVFEVGDTQVRVLAIQGTPDDRGENVFRYGSSLVYFKNGLVSNWSDGLPRLRVHAWTAFDASLLDTFSVGSTRGDVIRAQGAPAAFTLLNYQYGTSSVFFENDRVTGWSEGDVALKDLSMPTLPFFDLDSLTFR
jgi:hypothetical protein